MRPKLMLHVRLWAKQILFIVNQYFPLNYIKFEDFTLIRIAVQNTFPVTVILIQDMYVFISTFLCSLSLHVCYVTFL